MHILHLDAGREMRGGQWQVLRLIEGLATEGVDSTLLARAGAPLFTAARRKGWRVMPLGVARAAWLARHSDVMHAHDARSHMLAAVAGSTPLVVSRRVAFPPGWAWKYRRPRRFLAVSEFVKSVLVSGGVAPEKIAVVPDGVPLLEPAHGGVILAPAQSADTRKGTPLACEAARLASAPLQLSSDLERDLRQAAMLVYISYSEGLGSAALLAMAAGVPVIASRVGGLPEIVRDGETGILVENSAPEIAAALTRLMGDTALARRMGSAARRSVEEGFTIRHMVRRTMEIYRQVLS
ncbi:MAG TPA: glycosyltransferase family 4 protein [Bryobacteraceae bacterium]|nr:glycosyltransferase family 4 protein [Bryobacteraceae bacterium]